MEGGVIGVSAHRPKEGLVNAMTEVCEVKNGKVS